MKVAIIGSGRLARAASEQLTRRGVSAQMHSRATGFDVLDHAAPDTVGDIDVVIEATDIQTQKASAATEFFVRSTRAVNALAARSDARHILVSIVGCQHPELQGNGYYAGKAAQERVAESEHSRLTIVRSTTWHEFARQNLERFTIGPLALVPSMTIQPVALDAVAQAVAECATGERAGAVNDFAGPGETTLWQMTKALADKRALPVPLRVPGTAGRAMRNGALLPSTGHEVIGPPFSDWVALAVLSGHVGDTGLVKGEDLPG